MQSKFVYQLYLDYAGTGPNSFAFSAFVSTLYVRRVPEYSGFPPKPQPTHLSMVERIDRLGLISCQLAVDILAAPCPDTEIGLTPVTTEGDTRMKDGKQTDSDEDHGAFEDHEERLRVGNVATETFLELRNTEDASDEDGEGGDGKEGFEDVETSGSGETGKFGSTRCKALVHHEAKVRCEDDEQCKRRDLEGETSNPLNESARC